MSRHKKNNIYAILIMAVIVIASFVVTTALRSVEPTEHNTQYTYIDRSVAYELPRLNNHQPEQVIEHLGYTVRYPFVVTDRKKDLVKIVFY